ncbi:Reticulocalbin 1 EF-hand calcium binding domain [Fasciolopsis buskii]|uniref:Reticulocalbin-3 n=1 Tax=Fasciolopsis buskii TaxID=27845 RepID=A0A8E0S2A5_9TREM|nr:Reticulocalbin 1 EF-hand calcium binding domain [Fasciolopsis buski]
MQPAKLFLTVLAIFIGWCISGLCAEKAKDLSWYLAHEHELSVGGSLHDRGPYELTANEIKLILKRFFQRIDHNKDKKISQTELYNWINYVSETMSRRNTIRSWLRLNPLREKRLSWQAYVTNTYGLQNIDQEDEQKRKTYTKYLMTDKRRWAAADVNRDGLLTIEEYNCFVHPVDKPHMRETIISEFIDVIDQNGDHKISEDEYLDELSKSYHVGISRGMKEPQWVAREREQFALYRDLNKDGKLDRKEVGEWVVPVDYDSVDAEVQHIFYQADFNRDDFLTEEEITAKQEMFIHSQAMNYGNLLKNPHSV